LRRLHLNRFYFEVVEAVVVFTLTCLSLFHSS
jgi:hypothetical protein